eukprot:m.108218 g.108218  ORF g.108218 m.108218 type:complete len:51 (+) comp27854_c0_seq1:2-154(+)
MHRYRWSRARADLQLQLPEAATLVGAAPMSLAASSSPGSIDIYVQIKLNP